MSLQGCPRDVLLRILYYLSPPSLALLCSASRSWNELVTPMLYKEITFDWGRPPIIGAGPWRPVPVAHLLLRTLLVRPSLGHHITSFSLVGISINERCAGDKAEGFELLKEFMPFKISWSLAADFNSCELSLAAIDCSLLVQANLTPFVEPGDNVLLILLQKLIKLRRLSIDMDFFYCHGLAKVLRRQAIDGALDRLETIKFGTDDFTAPYSTYHRCEVDVPLFLWLPRLRKFSAAICLESQVKDSLPQSFIQELILHDYRSEDFVVGNVLSAMPKLRYLEYYLFTDLDLIIEERKARLRDGQSLTDTIEHRMMQALRPLRHTLESLHIYENYARSRDCHIMDRGLWPGRVSVFTYTRIRELKDFTQLQCLQLQYEMLLGPEPGSYTIDTWDDVLPASLRSLILLDNYMYQLGTRWNERSLIIASETLVLWLGLRRGIIKSHFGLRLRIKRIEGKSELSKNVMVYAGEISRLCNSNDVTCSIEVTDLEVDY